MIKIIPPKQHPRYETGVNEIGLVNAEIDLFNAGDVYLLRTKQLTEEKVRQLRVNSLVDSGAYMLVINDQIKSQLSLPFIEKKIATSADDSTV